MNANEHKQQQQKPWKSCLSHNCPLKFAMSSCIATNGLGAVLQRDYKEDRIHVLLTTSSNPITGIYLFIESVINLSMICVWLSNWAATFRRSPHPILATNTSFALSVLKPVSN